MDGRAAALVAGGVIATVGVTGALLERRRRGRWVVPGRGGLEAGGVREPRRPLVPAGSGAAELPLPDEGAREP